MRDLEIVDGITSFEEAREYLQKYGEVRTEIDLPKITKEETSTVTEQCWHQDGLQTDNPPNWQALWCEHASGDVPTTQFISTRIPEGLALAHEDMENGYKFKQAIEEGSFFKFKTEAEKRLYLRRMYKGVRPLIGKDDKGYYTRWCEFSDVDAPLLRDAIFDNMIEEVEWKTHRLVVSNNNTMLHRRTPNKNVDGERILCRFYVQ